MLISMVKKVVIDTPTKPRFFIVLRHIDELMVHCATVGKAIINLGITIELIFDEAK